MADLSTSEIRALVHRANLAPSVHNTQPARWQFRDGEIRIYADLSKLLPVGDPQRRDLGISCGAAVDATLLALSAMEIEGDVEDLWDKASPLSTAELRHCATIRTGGRTQESPLSATLEKRFTWRGKFAPTSDDVLSTLGDIVEELGYSRLLASRKNVDDIARLNDDASLRIFRDRAYREELLSYMRLNRNHPKWSSDGMNRKSLGLSPIEGNAGSVLLKHPWFEVAARLGLAKSIITEEQKTKTASAILLLFSPHGETPLSAGRRFLTSWLEICRLGLVAWPMAVLADDPEAADWCRQQFAIPKDSQLINAFRIGSPPVSAQQDRARRPADELIIA